MTQLTGSPIEDIAYLTRSEHRAPTLISLAVRPRSRSELWEATGVSESTLRRTLREFEDRDWIIRDGYQYEVTQLGSFIASAMADFIDQIEIEQKLRQVWRYLPDEKSGFAIGMCSDATVSIADPDDPYHPISRFRTLLRDADEFRFTGFDVALLEPCKDDLCNEVIEGMESEIINPPRVADYIRSNCPDMFSEALASGNLTIRLHDDLPTYGVGLFDDRIAVCGYDNEAVTVRVLVDTDDTEAREWAETIYTNHRRQTPTLSVDPESG